MALVENDPTFWDDLIHIAHEFSSFYLRHILHFHSVLLRYTPFIVDTRPRAEEAWMRKLEEYDNEH